MVSEVYISIISLIGVVLFPFLRFLIRGALDLYC